MVDLHLHTTYSDGTDSVEMLLDNAEKAKLDVISITDHNGVGAYYELEEHPETRKRFSGDIIIGSEIKCIYDDINIEVLAYGIDFKNIDIKKEDKIKVQNEELEHFIKVARSLGLRVDDNIQVDLNDPQKLYASWVFCDNILQYKENEEIIKNKIGHVERLTFYREHEGNRNSPFYYSTSIYYDDLNTVIDKIHECGGLAFLAHGLIYSFEDTRKTIEEIVRTTKIDGLECIYPLFDKDGTEFMLGLCKKYDKFISGGSDYHAKTKPTTFMGTGINNNISVPKEIISNWINKVRKV